MTHRKRKKPTEKKKKPADAMILVISDGKSFFGTGIAFEIYLKEDKHKKALEGKKIGDILDGKEIDLPGYLFRISGATDKYGFMHHPSVEGSELRKVLLSEPPGIRHTRYKVEKRGGGYRIVNLRGIPRKKTVRGNRICEHTRQVNLVVLFRRGRSIKEMSKESILSDRILSPLAEKLGYLVLKNGLYRVRFVSDGQTVRLGERLKELGVSDDIIRKMSIDLGVELIKRGRKLIWSVVRPVLKCRSDTDFAKFVGKTLYDLYKGLSSGTVSLEDADHIVSEIVEKIVKAAEEAMSGRLRVQFRFKIKEAQAQ